MSFKPEESTPLCQVPKMKPNPMTKIDKTKHTPFDTTSVSETERYKMLIRDKLSNTDLLIQLSEECNELSATITKLVRKIRDNNPTPKTLLEIEDSITEEMTDVILCLDMLNGYYTDYNIYVKKLKRWFERLENKNDE